MLSKEKFKSLKLGTKVCTIDGPGQSPTEGLASREGIIYGKINDKWGFCYRIKFNDYSFDTMHSINTEKNEGIGYYLLKD